MKFFKDIYNSFTTDQGGFSARKLSAFVAITVAVIGSYRFARVSNINEMITIWLVFASFCLGIVTVQQAIQWRNGGPNTPPKT